jgi:putative peptide zinc metalloprotease protein
VVRRKWRLSLCDPDRIIGWLAPRATFCFHPAALISGTGLLLWSSMSWTKTAELVSAHARELPLWASAGILIGVLLLVALVHELAHALTLHRFGGRVREMGLTTVALFPCFYCDVTDAYLLPQKRQRLAVALAGPFAQAVLGAIGSVWLALAPPSAATARYGLACTALIGVLSMANLFPFAKTDGYYALTELLNAPNLRRHAWQWLANKLRPARERSNLARGSAWAFWLYGMPTAAFAGCVVFYCARALVRSWPPSGESFQPRLILPAIVVGTTVFAVGRSVWQRARLRS